MIVCSVGGGGLLRGLQLGLEQVGWTDVTLLAVETEGAASYAAAQAAGFKVVSLPAITSIASSLGALAVTPAVLSPSPVTTVSYTVSDAEAVAACLHFADNYRYSYDFMVGATNILLFRLFQSLYNCF